MNFTTLLEQAQTGGLAPSEVVIGMVVKATVITDVPQADFKLLIHCMTKDETIKEEHEIAVPANGMSLNDIKQEFYGKFVLVIKDLVGRGTAPIRGKLEWSTLRNVYMSPYKPFLIECLLTDGTTEVIGAFSEERRRKYSLPMPERGWICTALTFTSDCDRKSYRFLYEAKYA